MMREPSFPADEFEKLKQEWLAGIEQQKTDPSALANNLFARISDPPYASDDPRYKRTFAEETATIGSTTLDQVKDFHAKFYGASDATAAIVGDFDQSAIEPVLRELFADWKSPSKFVRIGEDYQPVAARTETILTPDKANAVYVAGYGFAMRDDDSDYPAVAIAAIHARWRLSELPARDAHPAERGPQLRRWRRLQCEFARQRRVVSRPMIYNPQNVEKLGTAFREEIERAARDGFTAEELERAKPAGSNRARSAARATTPWQAHSTAISSSAAIPLRRATRRTGSDTTPEQVNAVMKKRLDTKR
jgi:zinc protease